MTSRRILLRAQASPKRFTGCGREKLTVEITVLGGPCELDRRNVNNTREPLPSIVRNRPRLVPCAGFYTISGFLRTFRFLFGSFYARHTSGLQAELSGRSEKERRELRRIVYQPVKKRAAGGGGGESTFPRCPAHFERFLFLQFRGALHSSAVQELRSEFATDVIRWEDCNAGQGAPR